MFSLKNILLIALIPFVCGCYTFNRSHKMSQISTGMTKTQVVSILGAPHSTAAEKNYEAFYYNLYSPGAYSPEPYIVRFVDERVDKYGHHSTFQYQNMSPDVVVQTQTNTAIINEKEQTP